MTSTFEFWDFKNMSITDRLSDAASDNFKVLPSTWHMPIRQSGKSIMSNRRAANSLDIQYRNLFKLKFEYFASLGVQIGTIFSSSDFPTDHEKPFNGPNQF